MAKTTICAVEGFPLESILLSEAFSAVVTEAKSMDLKAVFK